MCMPVYSNSLTITANEQKSELIFTFKHKYPVIGEDGAVSEYRDETVSSIIVNEQMAKSIRDTMNQVFGEQVD
nr:MAG TPA: hypothetical protein [Caudoviricetes sp.]